MLFRAPIDVKFSPGSSSLQDVSDDHLHDVAVIRVEAFALRRRVPKPRAGP